MVSMLSFPSVHNVFLRDLTSFRRRSSVHTATVQGTVVAVYEVGCLFGAIFAFYFGEILGRRRMMFGKSGFLSHSESTTFFTFPPPGSSPS